MGGFAAGLASIGGSLAQAQELQRKEKIEQVKLALEQAQIGTEKARLGLEQQNIGVAKQREAREQLEFQERKRLAGLPKFVGFRAVGDRLYYGLQNPDGTMKIQEATGVDASGDAQALESEIEQLPSEAQPAARAMIVPYIQAGNYRDARGALKPIMQKYAESQLPAPVETTRTTETHELDTPQGRKLVQVPKVTTKTKGPVAQASKVGGGGRVTREGGGGAQVPRSPGQIAKDLGLPAGSKVIGVKPPSRTEISKVIDPVGDADRRYKVMLDAAAHPNPQNDVALLFNHIGMTLSAQRGARITSAEITRAIEARSIPEDLQALWQKVVNGQFLTIPQRQNMLALGKLNREFIWQQAWEKAKSESMANYLPKTLAGLPPVAGVYFVGEDVQLAKGGRARITQINPNGSYEVKPY